MKKRVNEWLNLASEDLQVAELCFKEEIYNQACFHAQQCVEKSLKAVIENDRKVPKLHRLIDLLEIVSEINNQLSEDREDFEFLDKFYTSTRYPFIVGMLPGGAPTKSDASKAIELAKEINAKISSNH